MIENRRTNPNRERRKSMWVISLMCVQQLVGGDDQTQFGGTSGVPAASAPERLCEEAHVEVPRPRQVAPPGRHQSWHFVVSIA